MPHFDVFSPSRSREVRDISLTLEAGNWMLALRGFLQSLGQDPDDLHGMMCDARADGSFVLTFPSSNRWFRIQPREHAGASLPHLGDLDEGPAGPVAEHVVTSDQWSLRPITTEARTTTTSPESASGAPRADETTAPAVLSPLPAPPATASTAPARTPAPAIPAALPTPPASPARAPTPRPIAAPAPPLPRAVTTEPAPAPTDAATAGPAQARTAAQVEKILEDIFDRSSDFIGQEVNLDLLVSMFLDLALNKVPSQAGAFYVADISGHDLQFAALRSPRARKVLASGKRVKMGEGVAGLCAQENLTLCINDLPSYPDLQDDVSFLSGAESRSTLCVAIERDGRCYGALQLVDRASTEGFDRDDVSIVEAIAHHLAEILSRATD